MYPDLNTDNEKFQLPVFKGTTEATLLSTTKEVYSGTDKMCRNMFSEVFVLLKPLLVCAK